jgi:phosphatidylethanolamine/phosphatidyl-N-methylethanolamine N-methyltransferase
MSKTDSFYNEFSFFYPLVDIFLKPQKRRLFAEINQLPPGELLEIGVGNGMHLHHYNLHQITGIDTSPAMLKQAEKQLRGNIRLLQMNGEDLLFPDESFDYIVLSHVIAVVNDPERLLEEVYRVLKPSGKILILNHFTPNNWLAVIDRSFMLVSKIFHFKSVFYINGLSAIKKFRPLKEICFGRLCYFKLLMYGKA